MADKIEKRVLDGNTIYKDSELNTLWDKARSAGNKKDRVFKIITAVDNGEQWSIYKNKIRKSQSLPVDNTLSAIRDSRQGSFSISGFVGEFTSISEQMDSMVTPLTDYFSDFWKSSNFDDQVDQALENMLTYGTGITMVTCDGAAVINEGDYNNMVGKIKLTNIDPSELYVDPGAKSKEEANYFIIKQAATIEYLQTVPMFNEFMTNHYDELSGVLATNNSGNSKLNSDLSASLNYGTVEGDFLTYIMRVKTDLGYRWDMVYTFARKIIHISTDIQPSRCPLVFAFELKDRNSFWGQSQFKKNLTSQLAINELNSAIVTNAKKQQDPVAIVNARSGLNVSDFSRNRDVPGRTFMVNSGTAKDAVTYLSQPDLPSDASVTAVRLAEGIKSGTGGNDINTGAGTGSLQTAGGISQVLAQASLKDKKVVKNFKNYLRDLYNLIIDNLKLAHGSVRYATLDHVENEMQYKVLNLDLINWNDIHTLVDITNHTASAKEANKQVIAELYQQAMQYGASQPITEPALITTDEYLQGIKQGNLTELIGQIMIRRQKEREIDLSQVASQIISLYLQLVQEGISPEEAIMAVSQEFSYDPGILKGFKMAELAQQQTEGEAASISGGTTGSQQTGGTY